MKIYGLLTRSKFKNSTPFCVKKFARNVKSCVEYSVFADFVFGHENRFVVSMVSSLSSPCLVLDVVKGSENIHYAMTVGPRTGLMRFIQDIYHNKRIL